MESKEMVDTLLCENTLKISAQCYNLEKNLQNVSHELAMQQKEMNQIKTEVNSLELTVPVLQKHEEILQKRIEEKVGILLLKETELDSVRVQYWSKIDEFINKANETFNKPQANKTVAEKKHSNLINNENGRRQKLQYLKVRGEMEAMELYENYQKKKIQQLRELQSKMESDSFYI